MSLLDDKRYEILLGDCKERLKDIPDNFVDSIVTDPPYELGFMNKSWDSSGIAYDVEVWKECLRVLKPGGYLLSFGGSRTYHRMACAIEDAGFEIRDQIMWVYGSGFPKGQNIAIGIDKKKKLMKHRAKEFQISSRNNDRPLPHSNDLPKPEPYTPISDEAKQWNGWNTNLKPAHEPIVMARKPFKGSSVENVLNWGVGGINVDGCRVGDEIISTHNAPTGTFAGGEPDRGSDTNSYLQHIGRYPANFIHDGSSEVVELFPNTGGGTFKFDPKRNRGNTPFFEEKEDDTSGRNSPDNYGDKGSAARYFYCAKTSQKDRNEGCEELNIKPSGSMNGSDPLSKATSINGYKKYDRNNHPTVKPLDLMCYLERLVTPKDKIVLDPFMGSGSTGKAAMYEGFKFIGIEMSGEYVEIAKKRIEFALKNSENKVQEKEGEKQEDTV